MQTTLTWKKAWPYVFMASWIIIFGTLGYLYDHHRTLARWTLFDSSAINGVVVGAGHSKSGDYFWVNNRPEEFWFLPLPKPKGQLDFRYFIQEGNTIRKDKFARTLYVVKDGVSYAFPFYSFDQY